MKTPAPKYDALRAMREAKFAKVPKLTAPKPKPAKKGNHGTHHHLTRDGGHARRSSASLITNDD